MARYILLLVYVNMMVILVKATEYTGKLLHTSIFFFLACLVLFLPFIIIKLDQIYIDKVFHYQPVSAIQLP